MERTLSKDEVEGYLSAVAAQIHTVNKATISVNLLVRKKAGELTDDEYKQLLAGLYDNL